MTTAHPPEPAWLHGHAHDPNPAPPSADPAFLIHWGESQTEVVTVDLLRTLPALEITDCYIVSTGHGTSGPFTFTGVRLVDLIRHLLPLDQPWQQVDVVSADGFGTRIHADELFAPTTRPIILSYALDGAPLTREQGLVRLIVPSETDDALRQVKWVAEVRIR
jgi:DMSO/TMAO reductase YedYZ molybdopterin-dependent catalytic subunit